MSASDGINNSQGKIYADGDLSFLGISTEDLQKFANLDGEIFSQGNLQLQAVEFLNEGGLSVLGDMSLQIEEGAFVNRGDLTAQGSLSIDLLGENFLENSGSIFWHKFGDDRWRPAKPELNYGGRKRRRAYDFW